MKNINSSIAQLICKQAVIQRGLTNEHAEWFSKALVETSLMGIDTHGLRLFPLYLRELNEGRSNATPNFTVNHLQGGAAILDADNALGIVAGMYASRLAIEIARKHGISIVSVKNSNHFGAASTFGREISTQGMIGLVSTSAAARVAPFNGKTALFGTNPICFSAPTTDKQCYLFDMATSQISYSQVKHYRNKNETLPLGCALNKDGEYTTNPSDVVSLAPLGGYKGQGLAMMVQILTCILSGMPLDHKLEHLDTGRFDTGRKISHLIIAIDVANFIDLGDFMKSVSDLLNHVRKSAPCSDKEVFVAGDIEQDNKKNRIKNGIPASELEINALLNEGNKLQLKEVNKLII